MASERKRRIVIPGGSGHVGQLLAEHFHSLGNEVVVLSRNPTPAPWTVLHWDAQTEGNWISALDGADVCIGLSGRTVNTRSTPKHRAEIYDSRIGPTRLLNRVIRRLSHPPSVWLNASTATIYRHALDHGQGESSGELGGHEPDVPASWAFSVKVGQDWENELLAGTMTQTRRIALRSSIIMAAQSGNIFDILSKLVRFGLGGTNGRGDQRVSWMHGDDFVRAIDFILADSSFTGVVNLAAPDAPTNRDFMRVLRHAWGMPFGLPAPEYIIQIGTFLMRTEPELVLKSRWVLPEKLQTAGFRFQFTNWASAADDLVRRMRSTNKKHTA